MPDNQLFYGDNLEVLRQHVKDESVDLVYLDPPFNSNADYNVLFSEQDGTRAAAQIQAFKDTWRWDQAAAYAYHEVVENGPSRVSQAMQAFRTLLGESNMLAYLAMMAPRLVELHRQVWKGKDPSTDPGLYQILHWAVKWVRYDRRIAGRSPNGPDVEDYRAGMRRQEIDGQGRAHPTDRSDPSNEWIDWGTQSREVDPAEWAEAKDEQGML